VNLELLRRRARLKMMLRRLVPDWVYVLRKCLLDFHAGHGAYPNILNPRSFSEKIQYRKLFDRRPILVKFADKLAVRDYVRDRVGGDILPALYHVTEDPADIPLSVLPDRFVVKPTHGCGWIYIVRDKSKVDAEALKQICAGWLEENYFYRAGEWIYKSIRPRILFEELLDDGTGGIPYDYKFFVFDGRVQIISVDIDRYGDHRRNMYDRDWNKLKIGFQRATSDAVLPPPDQLPEMLRYAETLAAGFDFLRIDLYAMGSRVVFGEITATPASGLEPFWPGGTDRRLGELWTIDMKCPPFIAVPRLGKPAAKAVFERPLEPAHHIADDRHRIDRDDNSERHDGPAIRDLHMQRAVEEERGKKRLPQPPP
jgi:hypothetical protein